MSEDAEWSGSRNDPEELQFLQLYDPDAQGWSAAQLGRYLTNIDTLYRTCVYVERVIEMEVAGESQRFFINDRRLWDRSAAHDEWVNVEEFPSLQLRKVETGSLMVQLLEPFVESGIAALPLFMVAAALKSGPGIVHAWFTTLPRVRADRMHLSRERKESQLAIMELDRRMKEEQQVLIDGHRATMEIRDGSPNLYAEVIDLDDALVEPPDSAFLHWG